MQGHDAPAGISGDNDDRDEQATFLELFFDLVFVYAITQIAAYIHHENDIEAFLRMTLIFALVWWSWEQFTWTGNGIDLQRPAARVWVLVATASAFFMAQNISGAFTVDGEWFSVPFAATMGIGLGLYWWGLRGETEHQRALHTYLPFSIAGLVVAATAGFVPGGAQLWVYLAAFGLFFASGEAAMFGTPFHIYPKHFAERHGLIVIIALGESIIAVGLGAQELDRSAEFAVAIATGMLLVCMLWWSYFAWFQQSTEHALRERAAHSRGTLARDLYAWAHLPIVFGIMCLSVAGEEVVAHPGEHLATVGRFGLAAGTGLFQIGIAVAHYRARHEVLYERIAASAVSIVLVAVLPDMRALALVLIVGGLFIAALASEKVRRGRALQPQPQA